MISIFNFEIVNKIWICMLKYFNFQLSSNISIMYKAFPQNVRTLVPVLVIPWDELQKENYSLCFC